MHIRKIPLSFLKAWRLMCDIRQVRYSDKLSEYLRQGASKETPHKRGLSAFGGFNLFIKETDETAVFKTRCKERSQSPGLVILDKMALDLEKFKQENEAFHIVIEKLLEGERND